MHNRKDLFFPLMMAELHKAIREAGCSIPQKATHGKRTDLVDFLLQAPTKIQEHMKQLVKEKLTKSLYWKCKHEMEHEGHFSETISTDSKRVRENIPNRILE